MTRQRPRGSCRGPGRRRGGGGRGGGRRRRSRRRSGRAARADPGVTGQSLGKGGAQAQGSRHRAAGYPHRQRADPDEPAVPARRGAVDWLWHDWLHPSCWQMALPRGPPSSPGQPPRVSGRIRTGSGTKVLAAGAAPGGRLPAGSTWRRALRITACPAAYARPVQETFRTSKYGSAFRVISEKMIFPEGHRRGWRPAAGR
jgi:hypothetical protein